MAVVPKGWCPSLFAPMQAADGLLLRVKPLGGRIAAGAARMLADAALRHGSGVLDLTNRGNVQVRGIRPDTAEPFAAAMVAAGLALSDPGQERRRNVVAPPLAGDDPAVPDTAPALVAAAEHALMDARCAALPAKFCVAVNGGGALGPLGVDADIVIHAGNPVRIAPAGAGWDVACTVDVAAAVLDDVVQAFLALPDRPKRMIDAHLPPPARGRAGVGVQTPGVGGVETPTPALPLAGGGRAVGLVAYGGSGRGAFGAGVPFGQLGAAQLLTLAALAERFGDGTLRPTPWRALMLPGLRQDQAACVRDAVGAAGLIADSADPRCRVAACPGRVGCASGSVDTRADAARLIQAGLVPRAGMLHVSGCAKGCAHPGPADIALVGSAGRYGLVRDGRARDLPARTGLTVADVAAALQAG